MSWISVKDRLPDKFGTYIVFRKFDKEEYPWYKEYNEMDFEYYTKERGWELFPEYVTHWMPAPQKPSEKH
jgi:hypothetical protein